MSVDLNLLRIVRKKEDFLRIRGRVPDSAIEKQTLAVVQDFEKYFEKFPEHTEVDIDTFMPLFRIWHPTLTEDRKIIFEQLLDRVKQPVAEDVRDAVMHSMLELRLATELANMIAKFDAGDLPNINYEIQKLQDEYKADVGLKDVTYISTGIAELLQDESNNVGCTWRVSDLNLSMRPLRGGDFGIIAGRPDKGKTTFIASEATFMAPQLPPERNVVWLNNEGPGKRIIPRLYQAALGRSITDLVQIAAQVHGDYNLAEHAYIKYVGRLDRIRVIDIHGMDNFSVEQIIEQNNAGLVIYDMIDNIGGFSGEARGDLRLEEMYKWGRELAVKLDHIGWATSQISADGDGLQWPGLSMLKDSKTGKQGACDFQLMIGATNNPDQSGLRFLSLPKNKLRKDTGPGDPRLTVQFNSRIARYEDLPLGDPGSGVEV